MLKTLKKLNSEVKKETVGQLYWHKLKPRFKKLWHDFLLILSMSAWLVIGVIWLCLLAVIYFIGVLMGRIK